MKFKNNGLPKVLFHHIPKTGGKSFNGMFWTSKCDFCSMGHTTSESGILDISDAHKAGINVVTFVRNPYSRFVSAWNFLYVDRFSHKWQHKMLKLYGPNINDFIQSHDFTVHGNQMLHFKPMCLFIKNPNDYSYIGRLETFDDDVERICELVNMDVVTSIISNSHENIEHENTIYDLDDTSIEILQKFYRKDFETFNYSTEPF